MSKPNSGPSLALALVAGAFLASGSALSEEIPLRNWTVPGAPHSSTGRSALSDLGSPGIFVPISPCRLADTRGGSGFTGAFGAPSLVGAATARSFPLLASGSCGAGIPVGTSAYSLNFTAVVPPGTHAGGFLTVFPTGGSMPLVSTLNLGGNTGIVAVANAAIVPAGTSGAISVFANESTDLIIDINGYFLGDSGVMNANEYLNVVGSYDYGGAVLYVRNTTTVAGSSTMSVISNSNDGSAAVEALEYGSGGRTYGVWATNASTNLGAAAVAGFQGGTTANLGGFGPAGVYGSSTNSYGVLGVSYNYGISGVLEDPSGAILAAGDLGKPHNGSSTAYGVYSSGDFGGTGAKYFVEPHPEDPSKVIKYVALEGPESGTYFRGRGRFVGGAATIDVPESFRMVSDSEGLTVQITPIGRPAAVAVTRMGLDGIEAESTRDVEFSYLVQGVRKAFRDFHEIQKGSEFRPRGPNDRMPAYLTEEAKRRLVANGTYRPDGTVNMTTAGRIGWLQQWREEEEVRRQDAEKASREAAARDVQPAGGIPLLR